jgi:hypothetical protein
MTLPNHLSDAPNVLHARNGGCLRTRHAALHPLADLLLTEHIR